MFRTEDIDLFQELPPYFKEIKDFQFLLESEQIELRLFQSYMMQVYHNFFIQSADEATLRDHEKLLKIIINDGDTLAIRRLRILSRYRRRPPFTLPVLKEMLNELIGVSNWRLNIDNSKFTINLYTYLSNLSMYLETKALLIATLPAHILIDLRIENILPETKIYIGAHEATAIRKTTFENELLYKDNTETKIVSGLGVIGVYRRTTINT